MSWGLRLREDWTPSSPESHSWLVRAASHVTLVSGYTSSWKYSVCIGEIMVHSFLQEWALKIIRLYPSKLSDTAFFWTHPSPGDLEEDGFNSSLAESDSSCYLHSLHITQVLGQVTHCLPEHTFILNHVLQASRCVTIIYLLYGQCDRRSVSHLVWGSTCERSNIKQIWLLILHIFIGNNWVVSLGKK